MQSSQTQQVSSVVSYGVSAQLSNDFSLLRETKTCCGTNRKFFDKSVDLLARNIICRNYGSLCFELSHLCWAIIHHSPKSNLIDFFWLQNSHTPNGFMQFFEKDKEQAHLLEHAQISIHENTLSMTLFKKSFLIHASRANILSCFMEWLVGSLESILDKIETCLYGEGFNAIKALSSLLQKLIYAYLSEHLPTAKLQRRLRLLDDFYCKTTSPNNEQLNKCLVIDDANILAFWQKYKNIEGHSKYFAVVEESLTYVNAIEEVRNKGFVANAQSTENFMLESVLSTEQLFACLPQDKQDNIDYESLLNPPKALTKQQYSIIKLLSSHFEILMFAQSWLRANCFGQAQNAILQSIRQKQTIDIEDAISKEADYEQLVHQVLQLIEHNNDTLLANIAVLQMLEPFMALSIIQLMVDADERYERLAIMLKIEFARHTNANSDDLLKIIEGQACYREFTQKASKALQKNNRKGFTDKSMMSVSNYIYCSQQLLSLNSHLKLLLASIEELGLSETSKFSTDRLIFIEELSQLYSQGAK
ncbi:hypothetical protein [Glaciecola petra]|uniref:Uncharacterized protein n=1 Tax=Glaciecola petra TaxID=3075602 RepID=A0ABU2ZNX7_9ALTE|nr:hypothetical protein [Aestuariibacter sp. P117]MDT0594054.1 hypothetical protein [Aestuariibacter sp. P117]